MQVVDNWVVAEALNPLLHSQVLVYDDFETAAHLLVIDFISLASQLLLLQVNHVKDLCTCVQLEAFMDFLFDLVHLLHHESLLTLSALHILDTLLLDTVEDLLLGRLVDVIENLQLRPMGVLALPLLDVSWIKGFVVIDKVSQIVSSYCHCSINPRTPNEENKSITASF